MNKKTAIYGLQAMVGMVALAAGAAKIAGADFMVQPFEAIGLGSTFRLVAGSAELLGGLCLLLPRGGVIGAFLMACVMVGVMGATVGHAVTQGAQPATQQVFVAKTFQAVTGKAQGAVTIGRHQGWDI
jgi:putative oxidoreductase